MSYHQGSVWPLFTGWAALAEYRGGQPLAGYQMLMENANLTRSSDLGAHTELLSGDFFVPYGRSTSHQLWSSAMVITPTLRGLFGIDIDAQGKTITVNPHLPASWDHAAIKHVRVGDETVDLDLAQDRGQVTLSLHAPAQSGVKLVSDLPGAKQLPNGAVAIPRQSVAVAVPFRIPLPGDRTQSMRVLKEEHKQRQLTLTVEGVAGTEAEIPLYIASPVPKLAAQGAELSGSASKAPTQITLHFPPGEGWKTITVTLTW
jgi:hypothetical protein